jgi:hypothetical protein
MGSREGRIVRWLYKIWSGYDGFRPNQIPRRLAPGGELNLGWARYADVAEPGDDVWVWFYGPGSFIPGVYVKGIAESIDPVAQQLVLQTQRWSATGPLTSATENAMLAPIVAPRGRQVFVLPEDFRRFDQCTATLPGATSCASRQCDFCTYWDQLPVIRKEHVRTPSLLKREVIAFAPGYWVVATRSFVWKEPARTRPGVKRSTNLFYRFKVGEAALAYPLAKGMVRALAKRGHIEADAIVPIPLSPEKVKLGEIHRTRLLAEALSGLINVPVIEALELTAPKGKRASLNAGESPYQFRMGYASLLAVDARKLLSATKIILVDDVCTNGNTLAASIKALRAAGVRGDVVAATAGQMTILDAVADERGLFKNA